MILLSLLPLLMTVVMANASILPPDGKVMLGVHYLREYGDTPTLLNQRVRTTPGAETFAGFAMFEVEVSFDGAFKDDRLRANTTASTYNISTVVSSLVDQLKATNSDAVAILSVVASSFKAVTDDSIQELATAVASIVNGGRYVFLRPFPLMNLRSNIYGFSSGSDFVNLWTKIHKSVLSSISDASAKARVSMLWTPSCDTTFINIVDTNGDGAVNFKDDPFGAYYPGDDKVDWVGCSITWYPTVIPLASTNSDFPTLNSTLLLDGYSNSASETSWSMYRTFTNPNTHNKPFMVTDLSNGASVGYSRAYLQRANPLSSSDVYWGSGYNKDYLFSQVLTKTFLERYPNIKAACIREFFGDVGDVIVDATLFSTPPGLTIPNSNGEISLKSFVRAAGSFVFAYFAGAAGTPNPALKDASGTVAGATQTVTQDNGGNEKKSYVVPVAAAVSVLAVLVIAVFVVVKFGRRKKDESDGVEMDQRKLTTSRAEKGVSSLSLDHGSVGQAASIGGITSRHGIVSTVGEVEGPVLTTHQLQLAAAARRTGTTTTQVSDAATVKQQEAESSGLFGRAYSAKEAQGLFGAGLNRARAGNDVAGDTSAGAGSDLPPPQFTTVPRKGQSAADVGAMADGGEVEVVEGLGEVASWSELKVKAWLLNAGVAAHLVQILLENGVNGYALLLLSDRKLRDMGITLSTARSLILHVVADLREQRIASNVGSSSSSSSSSVPTSSSVSAPAPTIAPVTTANQARSTVVSPPTKDAPSDAPPPEYSS
ncbi:hypothetical protein HDU97_004781 [Phlyctochytrium planicorne]|nr:hypothetical protein HDU97_004781 [Phlyctochytrium planicorne]